MLQPWQKCSLKKSERALKLLTHRWWAAQRERACHRRGRSMWASSRSSAGKRLRRNTEGGRRSGLDTVHRAASSPAGRQSGRHRKWALNKQDDTDVLFPPLEAGNTREYSLDRWGRLGGPLSQFRSLDQIVVCLGLQAAHTQRSWSCDIWGAAVRSGAGTYCARDSVLRSPQSTVWVGWRGLLPWRPSLSRRPPSSAAIRFRGRQQTHQHQIRNRMEPWPFPPGSSLPAIWITCWVNVHMQLQLLLQLGGSFIGLVLSVLSFNGDYSTCDNLNASFPRSLKRFQFNFRQKEWKRNRSTGPKGQIICGSGTIPQSHTSF